MLNHTVLMGRIGQDVELKTTQGGIEVVTFSVAVQRSHNKEITDWINIVAWRATASFVAKYFKKGDMICIEGNIQTRNYEGQDGKKVYVTEVVAEKVHFVGGKQEGNAPSTTPTQNTNVDGFVPIEAGDDIPF